MVWLPDIRKNLDPLTEAEKSEVSRILETYPSTQKTRENLLLMYGLTEDQADRALIQAEQQTQEDEEDDE